jgi:hypothetical protein
MTIIQSDTKPKRYRIKKDIIILVDENEILNIEKDFDGKLVSLYEYPEYPLKLKSRDNMEKYIENNYEKLLKYAKENPYKEKIILTPEQKIQEQELIIEDLTQLLIDKGVIY